MEELIRINGCSLYERDPRLMFGEILENIPNIECWSAEALRELYKGLLEIISDLCSELLESAKGYEKTRLNRFITWSNNSITGGHKIPDDRTKLLSLFYSVVLKGEKLDVLRGYGFINKLGDNIKGNPEIHSLRDDKLY